MSERDEEPKTRTKEDPERSAEYHRRRVMSVDDRRTESVERAAKQIHEQNMKESKNTTYDEARKKAADLMHKHIRIKSEDNG